MWTAHLRAFVRVHLGIETEVQRVGLAGFRVRSGSTAKERKVQFVVVDVSVTHCVLRTHNLPVSNRVQIGIANVNCLCDGCSIVGLDLLRVSASSAARIAAAASSSGISHAPLAPSAQTVPSSAIRTSCLGRVLRWLLYLPHQWPPIHPL